jgi:hypothetical protein
MPGIGFENRRSKMEVAGPVAIIMNAMVCGNGLPSLESAMQVDGSFWQKKGKILD